MEDRHSYSLRKNRVRLLQELEINSLLCDALIQDDVLTTFDHERIQSAPTDTDKRKVLLEILPRKGENAYPSLIRALNDVTKQWHIERALQVKSAEWTGLYDKSHNNPYITLFKGHVTL